MVRMFFMVFWHISRLGSCFGKFREVKFEFGHIGKGITIKIFGSYFDHVQWSGALIEEEEDVYHTIFIGALQLTVETKRGGLVF